MKHTFIKSCLVLSSAVLLLAGSSCKKLEDFGDTNVDPFGSLVPVTSALLTNAQSGLAAITSGTVTGGTKAGLFAQYIAETQYTDASLYAEPKLDMGGTYTSSLGDLQLIINQNTNPATSNAPGVIASGSNANQIAVATILKTFILWTVTDRWGDVPYSQALQGASNQAPAFDQQEQIYKQMLNDLAFAVAKFDGGKNVVGDIIYSGDPAKWKRLANTLRMQIALRMSKVFPNPGQYAATEFALAYADVNGYIMDNSDNMTLAFPGGAFKNPYFNIYAARTDYGFSKTIGDILSNMADGRKDAFKGTGSDFPYGLVRDDAVAFGTGYAKFLSDANRAEDAPVVIVSAATSLLAVAEGKVRGWVANTDAETDYNNAIQASYNQWGAGDATAYYTGPAANFTSGTGGGSNIGSNSFNSIVGADALTSSALSRIALQRYIAYFPDGIQGWSEWRRTGVPNLKPTAYATNDGGQIPRRYVYSTADYSLNPANVATAVSRLTGGDKMSSRMWWDQ